jgi:hypothetical protein
MQTHVAIVRQIIRHNSYNISLHYKFYFKVVERKKLKDKKRYAIV